MRLASNSVMRFLLLLSISLVAALFDPKTSRGSCIDYAGYLRWEGGITVDGGAASSCVAISGSLACLIDSDRLFLVDVIDPAKPNELGSLTLPAAASGVAIYGETIFVAVGSEGLIVVNAHDRSLPTIVRTVPLPRPAISIAVSGAYAFVVASGNPGGLYAFDVSAPASPRLVGSLDIAGQCAFVAVSSGRAYIAARAAGLQVIDVTRPSAPAVLGTVDTPGEAVGVTVAGSRAFVADSDQGLQIVDVSNPASPRIAAALSLPGSANAVTFSGAYAYVACGSPALVVVDFSEPVFPRIAGMTGRVGYTRGIAVSGQDVYLAAGARLLQVVNVQNPHTPDPIGTMTLAGNVADLAVIGSYVYVAEGASHVEIVLASQPRSPLHVGTFATPGAAIVVSAAGEDRLLVGVERAGLLIADVTRADAPRILGQTDRPLHPRSISVTGNTALVAAGDEGLFLVDISNATAPTVMSVVSSPLLAVGVAVAAGRYACVADSTVGLLIVDILDPRAPSIVGQLQTGLASDVAVDGQTAYVADGSGLRVVDITDPSLPNQLGRVDLNGRPRRVTVAGTTAYVVGEDQGLQVVDAQDPTAPALRGGAFLADARALRVTDAGVFVGSRDSRLWIMPTQCEILPVYFAEVSAEAEEEGVWIRWNVASDLLFDGFVVERADDRGGVGGDGGDLSFAPLNESAPISGRGPFEYLDSTAVAGAAYSYRVVGLVPGGERIVSGPIQVVFAPVRSLSLRPPVPNPARNGAALRFELDRSGIVRLSICDVAGKRIRTLIDGPMRTGIHRLDWDGLDEEGRRVAGGVYWIRLESEGRLASTRLVTLR